MSFIYSKKWLVFTIIVVLFVTMLSGCGSTSDMREPAVDDSVEAEDTAFVVNGEKISAGKFGFYIFNAAYKYAELNGRLREGISSIDWNSKDEKSGKIIADLVKEDAKNIAISDILMAQNGAKNGLSIEEEMLANNEAIENAIKEKGQDFFDTRILAMGITSVDDYKDLIEITAMSEKLQNDFDENPEKYIKSDMDLSEFKSDENVTVQHILIKSNSTKTTDPQTTINEICERAKSGEDFGSLMEEFNEDTAETEAGYCFGHGVMSVEFEDAAFALNLNEISDVVRTEHGYHVIKRLPGMGELINMWLSTSLITENENVIKNVSVEDVIKSAADAAKKLKEEYAMSATTEMTDDIPEEEGETAKTSTDKKASTEAKSNKSKTATSKTEKNN